MNVYEKQGLLLDAIKDEEAQLGFYLSVDGCEKTDIFARVKIANITKSQNLLNEMYEKEIVYENGPVKSLTV